VKGQNQDFSLDTSDQRERKIGFFSQSSKTQITETVIFLFNLILDVLYKLNFQIAECLKHWKTLCGWPRASEGIDINAHFTKLCLSDLVASSLLNCLFVGT
jgi:hypothetical protein